MQPVSSKRMKRLEKKKKKMAALLEISKLNEYDRLKNAMTATEATNEVEPSPKKPRTELTEEAPEIGLSGKPKVSGEEYLQIKRMLRERSLKMRGEPRFRLREIGETAVLSVNADERIPLFLSDIQHLIMYSQIGHHSPYSPARWCQLEKFSKLHQTSVIVVENLSLYDFQSHESFFPFLSSTFSNKIEVITPGAYKGDIVHDLATVPLTGTQVRKYVDKFGTLEAAVEKSSDVFDRIRDLFPVQSDKNQSNPISLPKSDNFPRTHLLLSGWQMVEENFPLPIKGLMERKYAGYVLTKDIYQDVTPKSPMFGIDCEMCRTSSGELELTRISIVDETCESLYEELVKPDNEIVDYLTRFSGITPKMMRGVTKTLKQVQEDIRTLLPADAILVGQSISNDLHALKLMHPYVIDTSIIFNITGDRARKTKLQTLAREFLSERIQEGKRGHCSIEDSLASLKLAKHKLKHDLYYGDAVMANVATHVKHHPELGHPHFATSMLKQVTKVEKTAVVVAEESVARKYSYYTFKDETLAESSKIKCVSEQNSECVMKKLCAVGRNYSLNIGHMRANKPEEAVSEFFLQIDKWVQDVYKAMFAPGLCVVIFGGQSQAGNGCSFITLKRSH